MGFELVQVILNSKRHHPHCGSGSSNNMIMFVLEVISTTNGFELVELIDDWCFNSGDIIFQYYLLGK